MALNPTHLFINLPLEDIEKRASSPKAASCQLQRFLFGEYQALASDELEKATWAFMSCADNPSHSPWTEFLATSCFQTDLAGIAKVLTIYDIRPSDLASSKDVYGVSLYPIDRLQYVMTMQGSEKADQVSA